jgi:hypothetical protein
LKPNIIFFSFMLTVPISKVFIQIVMFDMKQFAILHLNKKCWRSSWQFDSLQRWYFPVDKVNDY